MGEPLGADEIGPGLVAFIDQEMIDSLPGVLRGQPGAGRSPRPFVCYAVADGLSWWAPITTEERTERLLIEVRWRSGGDPQWLRDRQFLADGANMYCGPVDAFVAASHLGRTTRSTRARISEEGLDAVRRMVEERRVWRTGEVPDPPSST